MQDTILILEKGKMLKMQVLKFTSDKF